MKVEIKVHGLREIEQAMKALPGRMDKKLLDKGLVAGARLVRDEAKALVPLLKEPDARRVRGTIQRAIHAGRVRPTRYRATVWVRVRQLTKGQIRRFKRTQLRHNKRARAALNPNDPFYWFFVEFGTSKMAARPFMRPAFQSKKEAAVSKAIATLRPLVQEQIAKLGRRAGP